ncbi:TonB-dependent receptor [uncultured Algimonas sp.]|uniref:TonB-dependent receptor n=1 Tax=uncultured Algimonas sp. TaxID=1547920 RepID=UPI00262C3EAD|nr:TonB-dependent receptor [uncultured Algimonas sp.]
MSPHQFIARSALLGAACAAATLSSAAAQPVPDIGIDAEDEIIVTATRRAVPAEALPGLETVFDIQDIRDQQLFSSSLVDIVSQRVPSFSPTRQKLSGAGESFRGRDPLFLIDGVPQSNPLRNGSRDGFTIDPAVVERVEVLYGANAIQGVGATGGVINYVTADARGADGWEFRPELAVSAGDGFDGDGIGTRAALTALRDIGPADFVFGVAQESRGQYFDGAGRSIGVDGAQGDVQNSDTLNLFFKSGIDFDPDTRLQVTVNWFELEGDGDLIKVNGDRATGLPATSIEGDIDGLAPTNDVLTLSIDFTRSDLWGGDFQAQGFHREFEAIYGGGTFNGFFNTGFEAPGRFTFDQSANNSDKTGLKLTYSHADLPVDGLTLTGGLDLLRDLTFQELVQTGRLWVPEVDFTSVAPFIQADYRFWNDRVMVSAGLRHEDATLDVGDFTTIFSSGSTFVTGGSPTFSETLPNIGATVEIVDGLTLFGAYSEGFNMPDVGRVLRAVRTPGQSVDTLLSVEPIVADNLEFGAEFSRGPLQIEGSWFESTSDFGQRLVANAAGIFEVRREPTEISGIELSATYAARDDLKFGAAFAALEGQSDQDGDGIVDEDLTAENISPDRLNLWVSFEPTDRWQLRAQTQTLFDRSFNDAATNTDFDGFTLVDLAVGYRTDAAGRFEFGVQNALDKAYITYFSQSVPGAVNRDDRIYAGRGRVITLRWSGNF